MKSLCIPVVAMLLVGAAGPAAAQRHKLTSINAETPEGQLLKQIGAESDTVKKLELLEKFIAQHPKHEASGWVLSQMQAEYMKAGAVDKAIAAGDQLLAVDPDDMDTAYANLKAAEKKQDPDGILKY